MSNQIRSGATSDLLTVDATSKAARATLYDSAGNELLVVPAGEYVAGFLNTRISAIIAAGSAIWAMRAGAANRVYIRELTLMCSFDGTAAATTSFFGLVRFTGANPTGGTALTMFKKRTTYGATNVQDARFNAGAALTVAGITFESTTQAAFGVGCARQVSSTNVLNVGPRDMDRLGGFVLEPNEGLALMCIVATVAGDSVQGHIAWEERTT
jgi:hypothetical protein